MALWFGWIRKVSVESFEDQLRGHTEVEVITEDAKRNRRSFEGADDSVPDGIILSRVINPLDQGRLANHRLGN